MILGEHTLEDLLDQGDEEGDRKDDEHWEIARELFSSKKERKKGENQQRFWGENCLCC